MEGIRIERANRNAKGKVSVETIVAMVTALGVVLGAVIAVDSGLNASLFKLDWVERAYFQLAISGVLLFAIYLCGFGAFSQPISVIVCGIWGLSLGACIRLILEGNNALADFASFVPFAAVSCAILMKQASDAVRMSGYYFSMTLTNENRLGAKKEAGKYAARFLALIAILVLFGLANCFLLGFISSKF